ncbi:beta-lactamase/transpeptidase-like protein [Aspergillus pseudonomiae]|uniref:Beta-lactamase/transpeptidase-like protein n=1 Tax=Aspergillus pseudonomiae TaxID=1506151 RepID=A0A5N7DKM1_9EURO|nr:beta-lactamase/transpeptidase-like protein [Aspergillus pseudonomiae]KAB8261674.1 beta-lactamase/transpeptidase-like protein [Aspergillus pseudonomiae]KAE8406914.1 beta-lactamase/transpeptidase-like protein [Aspergillus pseudonomiae]
MTTASLSPQAIANLRTIIDDACADENAGLPCANVVIVGKGDSSPCELFSHSTRKGGGHKNGTEDRQIRDGEDDIYWLASCTKLVTGIACMQLVERGVLGLDCADQVESLCPELKEVCVLQENGSKVEKNRGITLRMLLTHTAGFGYSFLNQKLQSYFLEHCSYIPEYNEFSGYVQDFYQPLVNQPGERFEYGISIDWAGILVERATGMRLNDYMQQSIFAPLGVHDVSMIPSTHMKERLVGLWHRSAGGRLVPRDYPLNKPLDAKEAAEVFHSGGAGLFGSIREFSKILATLLNDGRSPQTGQQILSPGTVEEMFSNQIHQHPDFARRPLPAIKPDLVSPCEELYPLCPSPTPQGWGLTFMISPGVTGRSDTTAHWSGLSNIFWWCDRERGVAGVVASQVLPFVDPETGLLWASVEAAVYEGLQGE